MKIYSVHAYVCVLNSPLIRRNRIRNKAVEEWPGDDIPIFKGKLGIENARKLNELVDALEVDCHYATQSVPWVVLGKKGIKQHILDTLNERRRRVHGGHSYSVVCKII